jgi:hypothetical protein
MTARKPWLPASAAEVLTFRSPPSVTAADQAEREPDSNPSAKIRSAAEDGVGVRVAVGVGVGVLVAVGVGGSVEVGVLVLVTVGVAVGEGMGVDV